VIDVEYKQLLNDRFSSEELCLLLEIEIEDFIDRVEDLLEEKLTLINTYLGLNTEDEDGTTL